MVLATLVCVFCVSAGLIVSFPTDLPSGPVIVVLAGAIHLVASGVKKLV
jgi:ABC-type Mn2+/Zn2+ transport system permease subunit